MRNITINENDAGQRIDRFLKKYLSLASTSMIQKLLRIKKIKVNRKKVDSNYILNIGDEINIFIYEEELEKLIDNRQRKFYAKKLNIVYEDDNIIIINKPVNMLSHASSPEDYGKNLVDYMVGYLIETKAYIPRNEKSFVPAIINRLDRNTSGLVVGTKNSMALRELNRIKEKSIDKYYKTIVAGNVKESFIINDKLLKDKYKNQILISNEGKESITEVYVEKNNEKFSLLRIKLVTGRTHQIRKHLSSKNFPIIGDTKYGDFKINSHFRDLFGLKSQFLHAEQLEFRNIEGELSYLNNRTFIAEMSREFRKILEELF